jgi:hypothetical protein
MGALVTAVDAQGPSVGTLIIGDVLLNVGSERVTFKDLSKITARLAPNALVTLTILRSGTQESVALKIGRLPEPLTSPPRRFPTRSRRSCVNPDTGLTHAGGGQPAGRSTATTKWPKKGHPVLKFLGNSGESRRGCSN